MKEGLDQMRRLRARQTDALINSLGKVCTGDSAGNASCRI
jgi:hypothetical protein